MVKNKLKLKLKQEAIIYALKNNTKYYLLLWSVLVIVLCLENFFFLSNDVNHNIKNKQNKYKTKQTNSNKVESSLLLPESKQHVLWCRRGDLLSSHVHKIQT